MKRWVSIVVGVLLSAGTAQGHTTRYVDDVTCPGAGAGTQVDPVCAIQAGIIAVALANGDDVVVAVAQTRALRWLFRLKAPRVFRISRPVEQVEGPPHGKPYKEAIS